MAPAPVGTAGAVVASPTTVATPTTLTPGTGSGYAVGDTLLCFTACRSATPTVATPSGWTLILNVTGTNGRLALFAKTATSTTEAAPSVVWSGLTTGNSGTPVQAVIRAFSGVASSFARVTGAAADGAASTATSAGGAGITTEAADDLVLSLTTRLDDAFTTFTAPAGFTNVTTASGTTSGLDMAIGWAYQVKATPGAVTAPNFGLTGATSFASSGVMVALNASETGVTPANETIIDNFDRADGAIYAGAGASLWDAAGSLTNNTTPSAVTTTGNQMGSSGFARSKVQFPREFDLVFDVGVPNGSLLSVYVGITDLGTVGFDGYHLQIQPTTGWDLRFYTDNVPATLITSSAAAPVAGSTIWIARRGTVLSVYYRPTSGGQFSRVLSVDDSRNNVASPFIFSLDATVRLDNLRGGPFLVRTGTDSLGTSDVATRAVQPFSRTASDYLGPLISYDSEIDVDSPVSHWKLGEGGSDSAVDRKGNLNLVNSNQGGTGTSSTVSGLLSNNAGNSASRMQEHQVFTPASTVYTFYDSSVWSYELWFKPNVLANSTPLSKIGPTPIRFGLNITGTITITATDAGGTTRFYTSTNQVVVGQSYHAVGTFDGSTLRLYVNGVLWISGACVGLQDTSRGIAIGNVTNNDNAPDLVLDEVAWYNSPLSLARIQAHYQVGAGLVPVGTRDSATRVAILVRTASDSLGERVLDSFTDGSAPRDLTTYNSSWSAPAVSGEFSPKTTVGGAVTGLAGNLSSAYYPSISQADVRVFATVASKPVNGSWLELMVRVQNPGTGSLNCYLLVAFANAGTDSIELYKFVGGAGTQLRVFQTAEYSVGDVLALDVTGTTISFYKNGVLVDSGTDGSVTGAGTVGIRLLDNTGALDNVGIGSGSTDVATSVVIAGITSRTGSDSVGTTDVASRGPVSRVRTATDALGTTDVATRGIFLYRVAASDTLGTTDSASRQAYLFRVVGSDSLDTTDVASRAPLLRTRTASDSLATTDVATRVRILARTASDVLAPSGYTTAQNDLFSTDTRSSYTSFGNDSISWFAFSGGVWDSTGGGEFAYMAAPVGWGNASDTARVRTSGRHYNAHTFARQIVGFVKPGSVNTSSCFYMSLAGTGEVRITFNSQIGSDPDDVVLGSVPGLVAGNDYILEFTRNGNNYTATVKNIADTTVLFTQTNAIPGGQQAAYGSGISLRPMVGLQRSTGGGGEAEIYGFEYLTQPLLDVATRGPITFARTAADSLVTTDVATSIFTGGGPALRSATDTLGTSDAAVQIRILPRTATDSLGTSDTATRVPGVRIRSAADTLGTADVATKLLVLARVATDLLGTTDVATRSTLVRTREAQDTLGTADVATSGKLIARTASDTLGTADVTTRLVTLARIASDALGTTDVATRIGLFSRTAVDTVGTTDVATRTRIAPRVASDTLGTADTATRAPYTRVRTAVDTLGTTDTALKGGVSALNAVDSLGTTDFVTRTAFVRKTGTDTLGTSDVVTRIVLRSKTATDTLGTSDVATRTRVAPRVAADALGTTDVATQTAFIRKTGTDTLGTSDVATRIVLRSRTAADTLGTSDVVSRIRIAPRSATDTLGTSDVVTRAPRVSIRIASDTLGTTDLVTGVRGKVRTATDTITLSDSANRAVSVSRFALDTLGTTDVSVIFTVTARTAEDTLGTFDSAVGFPFYPLSSSDTLGTTDEAVVSVIYTRTGSDLLGTFDHATRVVIAGPEAFTGFRFLKSPGSFVSGTPGSFGGFGGFNPGKFTYKGN